MANNGNLYLYELDLRGFKAHEHLTVHARGKHVRILGENRAGKSSAVDGLWWGLVPLSVRELSEPVHEGAKKAVSRIQLADEAGQVLYTVTRERSAKGRGSLLIEPHDGPAVEGKDAEQVLAGFLGRYTMDIGRFLDGRPQDQVDDVLRMVGVVPPLDSVRALTGEDCPAAPNESAAAYLLRLGADKTGEWYNRRLLAGRVVDQKSKAILEARSELDRLGGPLKDSERQTSATDVLKGLDALQTEADKRRRAIQDAEAKRLTAERDAQEKRAEAKAWATKLASLATDRERQVAEIERLHALHMAALTKLAEIDRRAEKGKEEQAGWESDAADVDREVATLTEREKAAHAIPDPAPKIAALRSQVQRIEADNARLADRRAAQGQLERLAKEHEKADAEHRRQETILAGLRDLRVHLLDGHKLPVQGLTVGEGELRLNGVAFKGGASTSEQMTVACFVAMHGNPRLRLLRLDKGEMLDEDSTRTLHRIASEHDFRVVSTCVRKVKPTDGKLRIAILDEEGDEEPANGALAAQLAQHGAEGAA